MNYYYKIEKLLKEKEFRDKQRLESFEKDTLNTYYEVGKLLTYAEKEERKKHNRKGRKKYEKKNNDDINSISFDFTI